MCLRDSNIHFLHFISINNLACSFIISNLSSSVGVYHHGRKHHGLPKLFLPIINQSRLSTFFIPSS